MTKSLRHERVRIYHSLRTAHLERAHQLKPASIMYQTRRYDFDETLCNGLDLIQVGPLGAAALIARSRVSAIEVNEPLAISGAMLSATSLLALRLRGALGGQPASVVSYAIENLNPFGLPTPTRWRTRIRRRGEHVAARFVWRRLDRIAYGTDAARDLYSAVLPDRGHDLSETTIPALPAACDCGPLDEKALGQVLFIGSLDHRKGIDALLAAWPHVTREHPEARLSIIGTGQKEQEVRAAVDADKTMSLFIDPERSFIHRNLRAAQVVVLLSQPTDRWREQVGLPIVEGLAHGCAVVTTTETGIAGWLNDHRHTVIDPTASSEHIAEAISSAIAAARPAADVIADLPSIDGRLAADDWLFDTTDVGANSA